MPGEHTPETPHLLLPVDTVIVNQLEFLRTQFRLQRIHDAIRLAVAEVTTLVIDRADLTPGEEDFAYLLLPEPTLRQHTDLIASKPPRVTLLDGHNPEHWEEDTVDIPLTPGELGRARSAAELCGIEGSGRFAYQAIMLVATRERQRANDSPHHGANPPSGPGSLNRGDEQPGPPSWPNDPGYQPPTQL